jgi:hypothetical protein
VARCLCSPHEDAPAARALTIAFVLSPDRANNSYGDEAMTRVGVHGRVLGHGRDHALGVDTSPLAERGDHEFDVAGPAGRSSPRT